MGARVTTKVKRRSRRSRTVSKMSTGENLLHILNTLESRAAVLEAELREIDEDIALNANLQRKYGEEFFTEGSARLMQTRVDKQQRLAEIATQLQQTGQSVQQGKQLLGSLMDNYGHQVCRVPACLPDPLSTRLGPRPTLWRAHVRYAR